MAGDRMSMVTELVWASPESPGGRKQGGAGIGGGPRRNSEWGGQPGQSGNPHTSMAGDRMDELEKMAGDRTWETQPARLGVARTVREPRRARILFW